MSQTRVVEDAVKARLVELRPEDAAARVERMMATARLISARLGRENAIDHAELLYDQNGLPK